MQRMKERKCRSVTSIIGATDRTGYSLPSPSDIVSESLLAILLLGTLDGGGLFATAPSRVTRSSVCSAPLWWMPPCWTLRSSWMCGGAGMMQRVVCVSECVFVVAWFVCCDHRRPSPSENLESILSWS